MDIIGCSPNTLVVGDASSVMDLSEETETLRVIRDGDDTVVLPAGWVPVGTELIGGAAFNVFVNGGGTLQVQKLGVDPIANAGGAYNVDEGGTVSLDGSGSSDPDNTTGGLTFTWDLDGDGVFGETGSGAIRGDETGVTPTFSAAGLDGPATVTVSLRVIEADLNFSTATSTVTVANVDPVENAGGSYNVNAGRTLLLNGSATDADDAVGSLTLTWDLDGDGTFGETGSDATRGDETGTTPAFNAAGLDRRPCWCRSESPTAAATRTPHPHSSTS